MTGLEERSRASDELGRILELARRMSELSATRVERWAWGTAYFNDDFPLAWDQNFHRVDGAPAEADAAGLAEAAEALHREAGHGHRRVDVDEDTLGARLSPGFKALGWVTQRLLVMVLRRPPDLPPTGTGAREVGWSHFRTLRERSLRRQPYATDEETVRQLLERVELTRSAVELHHVAAAHGGELASGCDLRIDGGVAEIDNVETLEEHRGKGLARAVTLAAAELAIARGCDLVFLVADDDDWPKELYGKLGFETIGSTYQFTKLPPGHPGL